MTKAEILKVFDECKDPTPFKDKFDWFLHFLKEHGVQYTFDSFQTLLISTDDPPALKIPLRKQGRRKQMTNVKKAKLATIETETANVLSRTTRVSFDIMLEGTYEEIQARVERKLRYSTFSDATNIKIEEV